MEGEIIVVVGNAMGMDRQFTDPGTNSSTLNDGIDQRALQPTVKRSFFRPEFPPVRFWMIEGGRYFESSCNHFSLSLSPSTAHHVALSRKGEGPIRTVGSESMSLSRMGRSPFGTLAKTSMSACRGTTPLFVEPRFPAGAGAAPRSTRDIVSYTCRLSLGIHVKTK